MIIVSSWNRDLILMLERPLSHYWTSPLMYVVFWNCIIKLLHLVVEIKPGKGSSHYLPYYYCRCCCNYCKPACNLNEDYLLFFIILSPSYHIKTWKEPPIRQEFFFVVTSVPTETYGERTFAHAALILWNNLPDLLTQWNTLNLL